VTTTARRPRNDFSGADAICHFCRRHSPHSPYRIRDPQVAGLLWWVCGPNCEKKPPGARVTMSGEWRAGEKERRK